MLIEVENLREQEVETGLPDVPTRSRREEGRISERVRELLLAQPLNHLQGLGFSVLSNRGIKVHETGRQ